MAPMAGVRGLLLDLDGVLVLAGQGHRRAPARRWPSSTVAASRTASSPTPRSSAGPLCRRWGKSLGPEHPAGPDPVAPCRRAPRTRARDIPRPAALRASPRRTPAPSSPASSCSLPTEADRHGRRGRRRRHRRLAGRGHLRQPQPRLPARPRRRRSSSAMHRTLVADAGRADPRLGRLRGRPGVRDRRSGAGPRQALGRLLPRGVAALLEEIAGQQRRPPGPARHRDGRRRPVDRRPGGPAARACAASSSCPASTAGEELTAGRHAGARRRRPRRRGGLPGRGRGRARLVDVRAAALRSARGAVPDTRRRTVPRRPRGARR